MTKDLITVVVPIYNGEKFIEPCVASIRAQTWTDLEILLVDDGSTDGSLALCEKLAAQDERIRVLHKENGGLGSARNFGMDHANGEFIGFCDVDDTMDARMYEALHDMIVSTGSDFADCGYSEMRDGVCVFGGDAPSDEVRVVGREDALRVFASGKGIIWGVWCKLFRVSSCGALRFPTGKEHGEDVRFILEFIKRNERFCWAKLGYYRYNKSNSESMTKQSWSPAKLGLARFYRELAQTAKAYGLDDIVDSTAVRHYENLLSCYIRLMKRGLRPEAKAFLDEMRAEKKDMLRSGLSPAYKADYLLCLHFPHLAPTLNFWYD